MIETALAKVGLSAMSVAMVQSLSAPTIWTPEKPSEFSVDRSCSYQEML
jgi:hypothetical protein